jgi:hypothetical protein
MSDILVDGIMRYATRRIREGRSMPYLLPVRRWEDWRTVFDAAPAWAVMTDGSIRISGIELRFWPPGRGTS